MNAGPAQGLAVSLLLRAVDTTRLPTRERVVSLAKDRLKKIDHSIGDGPLAERYLRSTLWWELPQDFKDMLIEADLRDRENDQAELDFTLEAQPILRSLRDQYRGREHEAKGLIAYLIGSAA